MRYPRRDRIASLCVAAAVIAYAAWRVLAEQPSEMNVRLMAGVVLALGVAASAIAVVPGFEELLHSSKVYLAIASLVGLAAALAGVLALTGSDTTMLAVLVALTVVMWVMATLRHMVPTGSHHRADATRPATTTAGRPRVLADHSPHHKS